MLWAILIGFLIGVVARMLMPGRNPGGFIATVLLGIGGAMLANFMGVGFGFYHQGEIYGFFAAVIGAMAILYVYSTFTRTRRIDQK